MLGACGRRRRATWASADASQVSSPRALGPARELVAQLVVVEQTRSSGVRAARRRRRAGTAAPASPTTSVERGVVGDDERRAARQRFQRREPEAFVARRDATTRRAPVQSASTTRHGCVAEHAHAGPVEARRPSPQPVGPTTTSVEFGSRVARSRSTASHDRRQVLAGLDGADREHVRRVDAGARDASASISSASRGDGRVDAERRDCTTPSGSKPSRIELDARERRRREHERRRAGARARGRAGGS